VLGTSLVARNHNRCLNVSQQIQSGFLTAPAMASSGCPLRAEAKPTNDGCWGATAGFVLESGVDHGDYIG